MGDVDSAWTQFLLGRKNEAGWIKSENVGGQATEATTGERGKKEKEKEKEKEKRKLEDAEAPSPQPLYISTMSKIAYLDGGPMDRSVFWEIPLVTDASTPGVLNKQILITSTTQEELAHVRDALEPLRPFHHVEEQVKPVVAADDEMAKKRRKKTYDFRDERKITIGTVTRRKHASSSSSSSSSSSTKGAFMNCFVLQLAVDVDGKMREFHTKVFNTGKVEIPGVQTDAMLHAVLDVLQAAFDQAAQTVHYRFRKRDNAFLTDMVLINSNFKCGFQINRQACFAVLKHKYNVPAMYDPCTYPGIKCRYYYDPDKPIHKQPGQHASPHILLPSSPSSLASLASLASPPSSAAQKVSFMIFRTGSVLIVGKCPEDVLRHIYAFVIRILKDEFATIVLHTHSFSS